MSEQERIQMAGVNVNARKTRRWGAWFVAEHKLLTARSYIYTIIASSIFNPVMYLFALGIGVGSYIDRTSSSQVLGQIRYLSFVGPALLCSAAINAAFEETSFPVMGGFRWNQDFYAMHATPLKPSQIADGVLIAALIRVVFTSMVFFLVLLMFGAMPSARAVIALVSAIATGLGIGALMASLAASLDDDDGWFALINRLVIAPLFLFSGTFYPLESMPVYLHWIGWISPLWHGTRLGRWAAYEMPMSGAELAVHIVYLSILVIGGISLARVRFTRRLME